jgi:hypothetical protein
MVKGTLASGFWPPALLCAHTAADITMSSNAVFVEVIFIGMSPC